MDKPRQRRTSAGQPAFRLPPDVSFCKQVLAQGWAYEFRHRGLGQLGRIVLRETADGRTHIASEVAGDAKDPKTAERMAIFKPLALEIVRRIEAGTGGEATDGWEDPPESLLPEPKELIESKMIFCERCGRRLGLLIFAPGATDTGHFEDYARKMYPEYARLNLPTWIIGPALGSGPMMERPAEILKVWPTRESIMRQPPAEFNAMIDQLRSRHCR
jgi:hypothetical protein